MREAVGADLTAGDQNADRDGQIEAAALLGQISRGEIDRDPAGRHLKAGIDQCGADAILGFPDRRLGQPDDGHARQSAGHVDLDGNRCGIQPVLGAGCNGCQPQGLASPALLGLQ